MSATGARQRAPRSRKKWRLSMDGKRIGTGSYGAGLSLILLGLIFLATTQGFLGLTWGNSWPIFLVAIGLGALVRGLGDDGPARAGAVMSGLGAVGLGA